MGEVRPIPASLNEIEHIGSAGLNFPGVRDNAATKIFIAGVNYDHQLIYTYQSDPDSIAYEQWEVLDDGSYQHGLIDCSTTKAGYVSIVAIDAMTNRVQYFVENPLGNKDANRWLPRLDLGAPEDLSQFSVIRLARDHNGMEMIFATSKHDANGVWVKHRYPSAIVEKDEIIIPPGESNSITFTMRVCEPPAVLWSDWINVSGSLKSGFQSMHIGNNANGTLIITGNLESGVAYVRQQSAQAPYDFTKWGGWVEPGAGKGEGRLNAKSILDTDAVVNIFALQDGHIVRSGQKKGDALYWEPWALPGLPDQKLSNFDITIDHFGFVFVIALAKLDDEQTHQVYANTGFRSSQGSWCGWEWVHSVYDAGEVKLSHCANGCIVAFVFNEKSGLFSAYHQVTAKGSEWYEHSIELGGKLTAFSLTRDMSP